MNDVKAQAEFTEFVLREMPAGTIISDPAWWAPRLWRAAVHAMTRQDAPVKDSLTTDERARFEAWWTARWISLPGYHPEFQRDKERPSEYYDGPTNCGWLAWQARAKIAGEASLFNAISASCVDCPHHQIQAELQILARARLALRKLTQDAS